MLSFAIFQIYNPSKERNIAILVKACYISRHGSGEEISTRHMIYLKQPSEVFYKNGVLKNFEIFRGKHLCQSLFLMKLPT